MADPSREQAFLQQRQDAHRAMDAALQKLRTCNPTSLSSARAEVTRCRRLLLSLSGNVPTSSDEEVGRTPLFTFGRVSPVGRLPAVDSSSEDEYYSTSSTSSGGSSTRDLAEKAALRTEYKQRPGDVLSRFAAVADAPPVAATTSKLDPLAHDPVCSSLGATTKHCDCSLKQARLARQQARKQQRLSRWFAAKRAEEAGADADDEADELRTPVAAVPRASGAPHLRRACFIHIARAHTRAAGV
ncbi:hypothetical protein B0H13DRAFT_1900238 [Mycena leptocephala]|nr:hypothetical protein B0H13DRAFT_1900238 [Mycena leptocephala]